MIWLPLACDEEIHSGKAAEKLCDVGFVGTVDSAPERRKRLLNELSSHFNLNCQRKFMDEMAAVFRVQNCFNNAINQDLNMRVFEAMCSGSLLVTDRATGSGLEEMFTDKSIWPITTTPHCWTRFVIISITRKSASVSRRKGAGRC